VFVGLPLLAWLTGSRPLGPLTPSLWYVATVAVMVAVSHVPHALESLGADPGSLRSNLSEFRELIVYWLGALFARDIIRSRLTPSSIATIASARGNPHEGRAA
jgi:hypothetical protein